ncbi:hypothetical protein CJ030_MR5G017157 [Morella rubra]|uniref:DUF789 domain-containing protein n=1 Tax=Morella rubra TaxID=262757 RepID=A0A6A1VM72_9ROSI|nr:hypothetical protein CJ030_MR5G017157 [Morella rubra]
MSASGGISIARSRGENRFYNPPHVRQRQQQQQQQQLQEKHQRSTSVSRNGSSSLESEKRTGSDECASLSSTKSDCSVSGSGLGASDAATNLDRFLEHTTPVVPAQNFPKTSMRGWGTREPELHPYFVLSDLWESFNEWSAYGAGVPLMLNGSDSVIQYYVPYLSGIQLYIDPSKPSPRLRRPGEESDSISSRESSSDSSSDYGADRGTSRVVHGPWSQQNITDASIRGLKRLALRNKTCMGSSSDESENCNPSGQLVFEYLEHDPPFNREPLSDKASPLSSKISVLASRFPELRTYKSSDLSPSSWISVAWYPIYRIPTGPTLQSLDACFLTFHSLSTPFKITSSDGLHFRGSMPKEVRSGDFSVKLSLPIFGLAYYKFKASFWIPEGVYECQKANSLLRAADNWLRLLQVNHPDYGFFVSHNTNSNWR